MDEPKNNFSSPGSSPEVTMAPGKIVFAAEQFPDPINGLVVPDEEFSPEPGVRILARQPWLPRVGGTPFPYTDEVGWAAWTREVLRRGYPSREAALDTMGGD